MLRKLLLALVAIAIVAAAFSYFAVNYQRPLSVTAVVDDRGTRFALLSAPKRLIALTPSAGRLLTLLKPDGKVVGTSSSISSLFPHAENLGSTGEVTIRRIVALRPDLVLLEPPLNELADALTKAGVNAFLLSPESIEQALNGIEQVGVALERNEEAKNLRQQLANRVELLQADVASKGYRPRVLVWLDQSLTYPAEEGFVGLLIAAAGGQNLAAGLAHGPIFGMEEALLSQPDIIIGPQVVVDEIRDNAQWREAPAIVENRLHVMPEDFTRITWENLSDRLDFLYEIFFPSNKLP